MVELRPAASNPRPIMSLSGISKSYGSGMAVSDVSLDVMEGELLSLVGASGSGKSTILMMIVGFVEPSSGNILVRDRSVVGIPPYKRKIGVVFQNYALFPHMTVADNLAFPLRNERWSVTDRDARVRELLEMVRLQDFAARLPAQLSGGQQQRVAIARALAPKPDILLLDEPLGALDRSLREHMVLELQSLHRTLGTTMIYVTHDQEEAMVMSTRIAVMDLGRLAAIGTPTDLYDNPPSAFVASFLGHSNILDDATLGTVAIRPERILIGPHGSPDEQLAGVVSEAIFLGDRIRYHVATADQSMTVLVGRDHRRQSFVPGEHVSLSWRRDDMRPLSGASSVQEVTSHV